MKFYAKNIAVLLINIYFLNQYWQFFVLLK